MCRPSLPSGQIYHTYLLFIKQIYLLISTVLRKGNGMAGFTAKLELPTFIPKEEILGKHVFDSGLVYLGLAKDWTYTSDGQIRVVVSSDHASKKNSVALIPFSHIDRVGQFILLRTSEEEFIEEREEPEEKEERASEKPRKEEAPKDQRLKYADEIDEEKLNAIIKLRKLPTP